MSTPDALRAPTPSDSSLMNDAIAVLDTLEAVQGRTVDRKTALTELVTRVATRDGKAHTPEAIEAAVDAWLTADRPMTVWTAPQRLASKASRGLANGASSLAKALSAPWRGNSRQARLWRRLGFRAGISAGIAAALVWWPWAATLRFPFVMAANHGPVYFTAVLFLIAMSIFALKAADDESNGGLFATSLVGLIASLFIGLFGGGVASITHSSLSDAKGFLTHDAPAIRTHMASARHELGATAPFDAVVGRANQLMSEDRNTGLFEVGTADAKQGTVALSYDLNPAECQYLATHSDPDFSVVKVNGQAVTPGAALSCPFPWENQVVIQSRPNAL